MLPFVAGPAGAQTAVPPTLQNVVTLSASASIEVPKDTMQVVFSTTRDGADAAGVQTALNQALDAALTEARKVARPQQVDVETGNFSLVPRYSNKGGINGWQGSAELVVRGKDMPAIAQLAGRIQTMAIARVGYDLSREAREKVEADVTAQAIARFRTRSVEIAKQFGFAEASVREVNVSTNDVSMPVPMMRMRAAAAASTDEALPTEAGKGTVTATAAGSVQMK